MLLVHWRCKALG